MTRRKVLFVGETWNVTRIHTKGFDVVELGGYEDYSVYFKEPLRLFPEIEITHIPNHLVGSTFPRSPAELAQYDLLLISDCGRNTLTMYPNLFQVPMGPDRVAMIADWVRGGGALVMAGGWVDFQGFQGKGNYHGSAIEDVLPVNIQPVDDRVETTQGAAVKVLVPDHPVLRGITEPWPAFLGYQRVLPKEGATVVASIGGADPFIVVGQAGRGRAMAFTSDLAPHWGTDFVKWPAYGRFWSQAIQWLTGR
jgi:uncharacterized membrane protein